MPCHVVLGGQWGDEGKGKIVDSMSAGAHAVVRFQGGANAGHTLVLGGRKLALHLVPSGVAHPACLMVLGNGMVIDPLALLDEVDTLEHAGLALERRLRVSSAAHAVLPCHILQDQAEERQRGSAPVGTTGRGIGPAYADKAAREGVRLGVFLHPEPEVRARLGEALHRKRQYLRAAHPGLDFDMEEMLGRLLACRERLAPLLCDTAALLQDMLAQGQEVLLEGAQGALLDLDHGSYPYVTSSSCTSAGALLGSGLPPQAVTAITGVVKAYATRVGNGPFPTELHGAEGDRLRQTGAEFGATTGRPRRCGWFDAVAARSAARLCGFTQLAVTKLDVLDGFEELRIGVAYDLEGAELERFPADADTLARCRPRYVELSGWRQSTRNCRRAADLPDAARRFLDLLEERTGVPVRVVSVGPDRDSTFEM